MGIARVINALWVRQRMGFALELFNNSETFIGLFGKRKNSGTFIDLSLKACKGDVSRFILDGLLLGVRLRYQEDTPLWGAHMITLLGNNFLKFYLFF